ncbi:MAG: DnaA regulatory inactivator Hda [Idiomarina sp.]|nr:DnaA regulatory inactivator Hda [Idiomarina sp.]
MAGLATVGTQLALPVLLPDDALFKTFEVGANQELISALTDLTRHNAGQGSSVYFWGGSGRGKTHLLNAVCAAAGHIDMQVMYIPLRDFTDPIHISLLQGLDGYDLVCLDDIDAVSASPQWCLALFALYNRLADAGQSRLMISASRSTSALDCALPDLRSRLQAGMSFNIKRLDDEGRRSALQTHAAQRGLQLEDEVAQFMVQRLSRDMHRLMAVLDQLDKASMAQQRRLTVPFVKQVLSI